jgi:lipopolysaccharide transport system permease protein
MNKLVSKFKEISDDYELLIILAKRDIAVRYKQTILGVAWAVIRPMATMLVFLFAFKNVANIKDFSGYPIQLVIFSGILFWNFFANGFQSISQSILVNGNLISKVYFPRLIICISSLAVTLVDFIVGLLVYMLLLIGLQQPLTETLLFIPLALLITTIFSLGLGLIFASYAIKYRDILQAIPLIVQYGFFVTPIVYTSNEFIGKSWYPLYSLLNPLASFVEFFRFCLIPNYSLFSLNSLLIAGVTSIIIFIIGLLVFDVREDSFVDHL